MSSKPVVVSSILWDIDDTLIATSQTASAARADVARAMYSAGLPAKSPDEATAKIELLVKRFGSFNFYNLCLALVSEYRVRGALRDKLINIGSRVYKERFSAIKPFPDSKSTLTSLKRKGYKLGIISTGVRDFQLYKLRKTGLLDYFYEGKYFDDDLVFISSDYGAAAEKPSPVMYNEAIRRSGDRPNKIMFIGDRQSDVVGANLVGMRSVLMVKEGFTVRDSHLQLKLDRADYRIGKASDVLKLLSTSRKP